MYFAQSIEADPLIAKKKIVTETIYCKTPTITQDRNKPISDSTTILITKYWRGTKRNFENKSSLFLTLLVMSFVLPLLSSFKGVT